MVKFGAPNEDSVEEMLRASFPGYTGKRWQPRFGPKEWRPHNRMVSKVVHLSDREVMICQVVILETDLPATVLSKKPRYPFGWNVPEMTLKEMRRLPHYLVVAKEERSFGLYDVWIRRIDPSSGDWIGETLKVDDFTRVIRMA